MTCVEGRRHRAAYPLVVACFWDKLVDDEFDEVDLVAVECVDLLEGKDLAVDPHFGVASAAKPVEELAVVAFAATHQGREQKAFATLVGLHDKVDNLLVGVADHLLPRFGGVGPCPFGVEEPQEVVDFSDGADRGAGVAPGGLLLNRDNRGKAADFLHLGLFQHAHEVLGVGGEGVHIAALAFGIQGVEGE